MICKLKNALERAVNVKKTDNKVILELACGDILELKAKIKYYRPCVEISINGRLWYSDVELTETMIKFFELCRTKEFELMQDKIEAEKTQMRAVWDSLR